MDTTIDELTVSVLLFVAFTAFRVVVLIVDVCMVEFTAMVFVTIVEPVRVE